MNTYTYRFELDCPNNGQRIAYQAEITADRTIMVENIAGFFDSCTAAYHEDIADKAYQAFGGFQVITAHHHGVDVRTERGPGNADPAVNTPEESKSGPFSACYCDVVHTTCSYCLNRFPTDPRCFD